MISNPSKKFCAEKSKLKRCLEYIFYKEWCNYLEDDYMKRIYQTKELKKKHIRLHKYYSKNLWKPSLYQKKIFRIQSRFYFCHERLLKGKNIYYISDDEENSETGSSTLISHNNDILTRFKK